MPPTAAMLSGSATSPRGIKFGVGRTVGTETGVEAVMLWLGTVVVDEVIEWIE